MNNLVLILFLNLFWIKPQDKPIDHTKIKEDLNQILSNLAQNYIYQQEKNVDLNCIREHYEQQISSLKTDEKLYFFLNISCMNSMTVI